MNATRKINNLSELTTQQFVDNLKSLSPRKQKRTRYLDGQKTIAHGLTLHLTRSQWEKVLAECDYRDVSYGCFIKLVLNQYFGLKPDLSDFKGKSDD